MVGKKKIAFIVQRYGSEINGGAELHCRWVAEHLAGDYDVEVLTTCAKDYITWRNEFPEGETTVNGIRVRRFKTSRERKTRTFGLMSRHVFSPLHTTGAELKWLTLQGPCCPALLGYLEEDDFRYDLLIFFSYRYWLSYHGVMKFSRKSLLVPTAEHDPTAYLRIFKPFFNKPRAIVYNSVEEKELINSVSSNQDVPGDIVGVGINLPGLTDPEAFRNKYGLYGDFVIYIGRIDPNKGCEQMFEYFLRYYSRNPLSDLKLVLIGKEVIPVPAHRNIIHLGFVSGEDKFSGLDASRFMIMPSQFESLSMVLLEAWFLKKAALVYGGCDVLKGQTKRSNGGLYYHGYEEFEASMEYMLNNPRTIARLGEQGYAYVRANYTWDTIVRKYVDLIEAIDTRK